MVLKVLVKGPASQYTGYGSDTLGLVKALLNYGADVYLQPTHVDPPLPPEIAGLLTRTLEAPFDLCIHHTDPGQLELTESSRRASVVNVAWTMWEYSSLDNLKSRRSLSKNLSQYDLVLGYDQISEGALAPYVERAQKVRKSAHPVLSSLQGGYWSSLWKPVERDWTSPRFGFIMLGQLHDRKDPFLAFQAFQELKQEYPVEFEPATLSMKTNIKSLHPAMEIVVPKFRIFYDVWPMSTIKEFYAANHVLLAPSRGEGKNLPALEFMSTGGAVIATNWGGMSSWMSPQYAYPLEYTLRPIDGGHPECMQARASKDHLKALMLHAFRNRAEVKHKAEVASNVIPMSMDWSVVVQQLLRKVKDKIPGAGEKVYNKAMMCKPREETRQHD